jgi:hypothetical protein
MDSASLHEETGGNMGFVSDVLGKDQPSAPAMPDYTGAAQAQGAANVETARLQGKISNPNVFSPLGGQTVTWKDDVPTITQTLTPSAQAALQSQQDTQRQLAALAQQGIGQAQSILGKQFQPMGLAAQEMAGAPTPGAMAQTPDLQKFGQATSNVQAGPISQGPQAGQYGYAQGGINVPNLQTRFDTSNVAAMPINAGTTAQQAILSRLEPALARQRAATAQNLANQGLVSGGEAYRNAMIEQNQQQNDLLTQAALQGLNLDLAANQQGFGQAAAQGQFGNAAQLAQAGLGLQSQQAGNQAIAQNFGQAQAAQQAANAAQQQQYAQQFGLAGLQNQALAQNQQTALTQQQVQNALQNQQFNQALAGNTFGNQAQQQALQQQLALYAQPLNAITGLLSGSQIQMPQFQGFQAPQVAPPPIFAGAQAQGQAAMNQYWQQMNAYNTQVAGMYDLLGSAAGRKWG